MSELAANAMLHAQTPFTVSLQASEKSFLLTVRDGSPSAPRRQEELVEEDASDDRLTGRLLDALGTGV